MRKQSGFSLIELMIVVAIIGILAAIAVPQYNDYVLRGKLIEGMNTLSDLRTRMEKYYQDERNYGTGTTCGNDGTVTRIAMPATPAVKYFTYTCTTNGQTFTLTATGISGQGTGGIVYTINHSNQRTTAWTVGATTTNASCWVRGPTGTC